MKGWKKGLAFVLAAVISISSTSLTVLADEKSAEQSAVLREENIEEQPKVLSQKEPEEALTQKTFPKDEVTYNLGRGDVVVGYDEKQAQEKALEYRLFDAQGNYVIELEEDAFFPYEVQFTVDGKEMVEVFETKDSAVKVGAHTFTVKSQLSENSISQIGFWVDGEYVAAKPESKNFDNDPDRRTSLLPIKEVKLELDASKYNKFQLRNVKLSVMLNGESLKKEDKILWAKWRNKEYQPIQLEEEIDLSDAYQLELIVGSAKQLDMENTRYVIEIKNDGLARWGTVLEIGYAIKEHNGKKEKISPLHISHYGYDREWENIYLRSKDVVADAYYVGGFTLTPRYKDFFDAVKVYEGDFESMEDLEQAQRIGKTKDVTDQLFSSYTDEGSPAMLLEGNPRGTYWHKEVTLLLQAKEKKYLYVFNIYASMWNPVHGYLRLEGSYHLENLERKKSGNDVEIWTLKVGEGTYNESYLFEIHRDRLPIKKIVSGHFNSLAEATHQEDIQNLLESYGHRADFRGAGQDYTIFVDDEVFKITVKLELQPGKSKLENLPRPGSSDTFFRVNGAKDLKQVYVLPYQHDSYYDMGYQTVFYLDSVAPDKLKPTFYADEKVNVYSGHSGNAGIKQISGETVADFSKGVLQYAVAAEDGKSLKNYWISYIPQHKGGAKIFVNGINGEDGAKREVFFTSIHQNIHDIFVANLGDQPLTGLKAELSDAKNLKLDPYWTFGGEKNNRLAAFTSVNKTTQHGELENVGKIRLFPEGEGELSGVLTISANEQSPVVIRLTGNAGDPKLTTKDIPKAVKYVPYGIQILHNNKYPWNKVEMKLIEGRLPQGVELRPNGEIYGTPKEIGAFPFKVEMKNSDPRFRNSSATYTLIVEDNTDQNVDNATDKGYEITKRIGASNEDVIVDFADREFISNGSFSEFVDFWLNGERLVESVDYTKEEGSTKITVRSQTFKNKTDLSGSNTIAAEFRVDGNKNKELKRSAQNFKMNVKKNSNEDNSTKPNGGGSDSSFSPKKPNHSRDEEKAKDVPAISKLTVSEKTSSGVSQMQKLVRVVELPFVLTDQRALLNTSLEQYSEKISQIRTEFANDIVILKLKAETANAEDVSAKIVLSKELLKELTDISNLSLRIELKNGIILTLSPRSLGFLGKQSESDIRIHIVKNELGVELQVKAGENIIKEIPDGIRLQWKSNRNQISKVLLHQEEKEDLLKKSFSQNGNIYAWINGSGDLKEMPYEKNFEDVNVDHPVYSAIQFVGSRELFSGISPTQFGPDLFMNRAMFVTVLHNLEGSKVLEGQGKHFEDVTQDAWYYEGVSWASQAGIIAGYTNGYFGVNDDINREQLSMMMYRYAQYIGMDTASRMNMSRFEDSGQISAWASDSMNWATTVGLFKAEKDNLHSKEKVSRAEMATVLMRFIELLTK